jgi:Dolichyl-phosphate-mannose-protein mannosyltransferase
MPSSQFVAGTVADATTTKWPRAAAAEQSAASALPILLGLAAAKLAIHLACSGRYGFFRDELYYIACGRHLAWGYVDQPSLVAVLARASQWALGDSLFAIRFLPALAGAAIVFLTGWIAREFSGNRFAQSLAALGIFFAPAYLAFDSFFSMNAFEPLLWMLCAYILIRILKGGDSRLWLLFGAIAGIGLLNKYTILAFGFSIVFGLLLTPSRSVLRNRWFWLGGLIALLIFLPNLLWQAQHHWPQLEVIRNQQALKNYPLTPLRFLFEQVLFLQPIALPLWLGGLGWLFLSKQGRLYRCFGWAALGVLGIFIALHGKAYYPLPVYPLLFAAGGVAFEQLLRAPRWRFVKFAYPALLVAAGVITLPFGVPVLSLHTFLRYQEFLPITKEAVTERDWKGPLPQLYADMLGWREMTATVAQVYHRLSPEEQTKCAILTGNYGEAGAIDLLGKRYGLPDAISGHNNYYLWGPRGYSGNVVISLGVPYQVLEQLFGEIQPAAIISNPYGMPVEDHLPVYICRQPKAPLAQMWPKLRYFI